MLAENEEGLRVVVTGVMASTEVGRGSTDEHHSRDSVGAPQGVRRTSEPHKESEGHQSPTRSQKDIRAPQGGPRWVPRG